MAWLEPIVFLALAALAFGPLEWLFPEREQGGQGKGVDLAFGVLGQALTQLLAFSLVAACLTPLQQVALERPVLAWIARADLRAAAEVLAGLVLFDVLGYAYHRAAHRFEPLWRLHAVHHSAERMDWLASFREHPLEIALRTLVQNAPLVLLGIPLASHFAVLGLLKLHTVFVHANLRVPRGPWSELWAMPDFHARHHDRHRAAANFASLFPALDHLFGTHCGRTARCFGLPQPGAPGFVDLLLTRVRPVGQDADHGPVMGDTKRPETGADLVQQRPAGRSPSIGVKRAA